MRWLIASIVCLLGAGAARGADAEADFSADFEGPQPSWRLHAADAQYVVDLHQRSAEAPHGGDWCEHLRLRAGNGTYVHLAHDAPAAQIVDETTISLWVRASRPGLELLARVVFPRSPHPQTGEPLRALLRGGQYSDVGRWQRLVIKDAPLQIAREVRRLRWELSQLPPPQAQTADPKVEPAAVDPRGAVLELVFLNAYGGPGQIDLWIDDLEIAPRVARSLPPAAAPDASAVVPAAYRHAQRNPRRVRLDGSTLVINDRPVLPRIVRHQGEPLELLQQRGFNMVWLTQVPSSELLNEAERLGVGIICPPPLPDLPPPTGRPSEPIGREFDCVVAWDLGEALARDELERVKRWAQAVRQADARRSRPLVCAPDAELRAYSRLTDVLLLWRAPLATSLELVDYGVWLRERPRLARAGTPAWTAIQTQLPGPLVAQWRLLGGARGLGPAVSGEQIRLLTYAAVSAGARGLVFQSHSRLDAPDDETQARAATLELLNLELQLLEPFVAGGQYVAAVGSSEPDVSGAVLQTDRARLVVLAWMGRGAQFVPGQAAGNGVTVTVPGASESSDVYQITPSGLRPLRHERVAGGIRVVIDEMGLTSQVLLTQDELSLGELARRLERIAPRASRLERELAARKRATVVEADRRLVLEGRGFEKAPLWLADAQAQLEKADRQLSGNNWAEAYLEAERASRPLRLLERRHWEKAVAGLVTPVANPYAVSFASLVEYHRSQALLARLEQGDNLLPGGGFENFDRIHAAGWRRFDHPDPLLECTADLSPFDPHGGRFCLRLSVAAADAAATPELVESAPLWVTSPTVRVTAGQMIRIRGWINVSVPVTGSIDGLMVFDSLAGQALALRFGATEGWTPFQLLRVAPRDGEMWLTFALTGMGEAAIDDVRIEPLVPSGGNRAAPPAGPRGAPPAPFSPASVR